MRLETKLASKLRCCVWSSRKGAVGSKFSLKINKRQEKNVEFSENHLGKSYLHVTKELSHLVQFNVHLLDDNCSDFLIMLSCLRKLFSTSAKRLINS